MTPKKKRTGTEKKQKAKERAQAIFRVHTRQMSVRAAAKALGVSRKTYYEWEAKALSGMMEALQDQKSGRPKKERDLEKEALQEKVRALEQEIEILKTAAQIRHILTQGAPAPLDSQVKKRQRDA
jgi:transposase